MMRAFCFLLLACVASAQTVGVLRVQTRSLSAGAADIQAASPASVHAFTSTMSERAQAKFVRPSAASEVVASEFIVTMADSSSPAKVTRVARQLQRAGAVLRFVGNQEHGWKGVSFKVPAGASAATSRLLDSLLLTPSVRHAQANLVHRLAPGLQAAAAAAAASAATTTTAAATAPTAPARRQQAGAVGASGATCVSLPSKVTLSSAATPSWGLQRISKRDLPLPAMYTYAGNGTGANVFVVDTGIQFDHVELAGRAKGLKDGGFDAYGEDATDQMGHGTHCAGTIAGVTTGISKAVSVYSVRVLDAYGSGSTDSVLAGINHVANSKVANRIMSMSLGGDIDEALNAAVETAVRQGVLAVVAAGNENQDACNVSPASVPAAITVGATDSSDRKATFSNWGKCVDVFGPGVRIQSAMIPSAYAALSGTSMAAPHVAGVAARMWASGMCSSAADCSAKIKCLATPGKISELDADSPNMLLYIPPQV